MQVTVCHGSAPLDYMRGEVPFSEAVRLPHPLLVPLAGTYHLRQGTQWGYFPVALTVTHFYRCGRVSTREATNSNRLR